MNKPVIKCYWEDLWREVDKWTEEGEQLIIGGDWNQDVRKETFLTEFKARNLSSAIINKHGNQGPETFSKGSKPIDEIFVSPSIKVIAAGYLEHGHNQGDHIPIWIEEAKDSALVSNLPEIPSYQARRLNCMDTRVMKKYNDQLEKYFRNNNMFQRVEELHTKFQKPLSTEQEEVYEELDIIREKGMLIAEKRCKKLNMGAVRWSPKLQQSIDDIQYIKLSISKKNGKKSTTDS